MNHELSEFAPVYSDLVCVSSACIHVLFRVYLEFVRGPFQGGFQSCLGLVKVKNCVLISSDSFKVRLNLGVEEWRVFVGWRRFDLGFVQDVSSRGVVVLTFM